MKPYLATFSNGRDGVRRQEIMAETAYDARKAIREIFPHARHITAVCVAAKP